jgi:hypothetical protein
MKFKKDRPFATPEATEQKLLELANAIDPDGWQLRGIWLGREGRNRARLAHDASFRRLFIVHASWGRAVRVVNVRFAAHCGLKSDIALGPKSANRRRHSRLFDHPVNGRKQP